LWGTFSYNLLILPNSAAKDAALLSVFHAKIDLLVEQELGGKGAL